MSWPRITFLLLVGSTVVVAPLGAMAAAKAYGLSPASTALSVFVAVIAAGGWLLFEVGNDL